MALRLLRSELEGLAALGGRSAKQSQQPQRPSALWRRQGGANTANGSGAPFSALNLNRSQVHFGVQGKQIHSQLPVKAISRVGGKRGAFKDPARPATGRTDQRPSGRDRQGKCGSPFP